jgi:hypothetical protein
MSIQIVDPFHGSSIDELVGELRVLCSKTGIQLAVEVGRLVLDRLYGGDQKLWHARGTKDVSLRKLQEHPLLPFRASTIAKSVAIFELYKRRNDLLQMRHLGPSHLHEVLGLRLENQDRLIEAAESGEWSVVRLRSEVQMVQNGRATSAGRRRLPRFVRSLRRLAGDLEDGGLQSDADALASLSSQETQTLLRIARRLTQQAEVITRSLANHLVSLKKRQETAVPDSTSGSRERST